MQQHFQGINRSHGRPFLIDNVYLLTLTSTIQIRMHFLMRLFYAVVNYTTKLRNKATRGAKLTKEELTFLSRNSFELLQLSVGLDVEVNTIKRKVLIWIAMVRIVRGI